MKGNALINTVEDKKSKYSQRDYYRDVVSRRLQAKIFFLATKNIYESLKK